MKRSSIILILLFQINAIIYSENYQFITKAEVTVRDASGKNVKVIPANTSIEIEHIGCNILDVNKNSIYSIDISKRGESPLGELIFVDDLIPSNAESFLPEEFHSADSFETKFYLFPKFVVDSIYKQNLKIIENNEIANIRDFNSHPETICDEFHWYEWVGIDPYLVSNSVLALGSVFGPYYFFITDIHKVNINEYILDVTKKIFDEDAFTNEIFKKIKVDEKFSIRLKKDGDYISFFINNERVPALVCCLVNSDFRKRIDEFIYSGGDCYIQDLVWPRHADGSCDYEKGKTLVAASSSATNVNVNKTMVVKENLKLRSAEATSSNVLNIMSTGTKVKVLKLGKAEIIDGINSNWVKVEVISGKDRDGNILKVGLSGWCYGGYLE